MTAWAWASLGDLCDVVNGGTPKTGVSDYWGGPHRWITPAEMGKRPSPYVAQTDRTITDLGLQNSSARPLPPLSVILSSRAPIGHLVINTEPMATNQGCKGLVPRSNIDHKFLYYYLGSIVDLLNELGTGATFKELSGSKLKEVKVPVPPIAEQQRIVAILDEAFEAIATAKANAEKNLRNTRAVFEHYLEQVFVRRCDLWPETTLGAIAAIKGGKRVPKGYKLLNEDTGHPYLRVTDFGLHGSIDMHDLRYVSAAVHEEIKNYVITPRDLYISIAGTIGRTGIIPNELDGANLTENACRLVFNSGVLNRFVYYFTKTPDFIEQAGFNTRTAAQPKLALSRLATIRLPMPKLEVQESIVAALDTIAESVEMLEDIYHSKSSALDELKKSLLHQAFTGRL